MVLFTSGINGPMICYDMHSTDVEPIVYTPPPGSGLEN